MGKPGATRRTLCGELQQTVSSRNSRLLSVVSLLLFLTHTDTKQQDGAQRLEENLGLKRRLVPAATSWTEITM